MQNSRNRRIIALPLVFLAWTAFFAVRAQAFSLLGPYAGWMTSELGYRQAGDSGGPMALDEEYRWNVPVVTYGFDKSFLDYFGADGVEAVEQAIQLLNDLPSASEIDLNRYPLDTRQINFPAQGDGLSDLKSAAISLLLEQMGLAEPTRNIFVMREMYYTFPFGSYETNWFPWAVPRFILERNIDPWTLQPSHSVNETLYTGRVLGFGTDVIEFPVNPGAPENRALADRALSAGVFYTGLTRDDVGGLRYLLSVSNVNLEPSLSPATARKPAAKLERRGGVEKIVFRRHLTTSPGKFLPMSLDMVRGTASRRGSPSRPQKRLVRVPDFLFSATDTGATDDNTPMYLRSDTSRWLNSGKLASDSSLAGPGIIVPPVTIAFHKLGPLVKTGEAFSPAFINQSWASFDNSPVSPRIYPAQTADTGLSVRLRAYDTSYSIVLGTNATVVPVLITNELFHLEVPIRATASLQTSTNQIDWITQTIVTNIGGIVEWHHLGRLVDWGPPVPMGQMGQFTNVVFFRVTVE